MKRLGGMGALTPQFPFGMIDFWPALAPDPDPILSWVGGAAIATNPEISVPFGENISLQMPGPVEIASQNLPVLMYVAEAPLPSLVEINLPVTLDTGEIVNVISPVTQDESGGLVIHIPDGSIPLGEAPEEGIQFSYAGVAGKDFQIQGAGGFMSGMGGKILLLAAGGSAIVWMFSKLGKK